MASSSSTTSASSSSTCSASISGSAVSTYAMLSLGSNSYCIGRMFDISRNAPYYSSVPSIIALSQQVCGQCGLVKQLPRNTIRFGGSHQVIGIFGDTVRSGTEADIGVSIFGTTCQCGYHYPRSAVGRSGLISIRTYCCGYLTESSCDKKAIYMCPFCCTLACSGKHMAQHFSSRCSETSLQIPIEAIGAEWDHYTRVISKPGISDPGWDPLIGDSSAIAAQVRSRLIRFATQKCLDDETLSYYAPRHVPTPQSQEFFDKVLTGQYDCKWILPRYSGTVSYANLMRDIIGAPPFVYLEGFNGNSYHIFEPRSELASGVHEHARDISRLLALDTTDFFSLGCESTFEVFVKASWQRFIDHHFNSEIKATGRPIKYASVLALQCEAYIVEHTRGTTLAIHTHIPPVLQQVVLSYCGYGDLQTSLGQFLAMYRRVQLDIAEHGERIARYVATLGWRRV